MKKSITQRFLSEYKKLQPDQCVLCGRKGGDLCHLLPRSLFPEHVTEPENLVIMCRSCHQQHDDNCDFRTKQEKLFIQACKVDEVGARRYYRRN